MRLLSRLASVVVAVAAVTTALASPAAAAPTYWKFKNIETQQCLTAGSTGVVYLRSCIVTDYQEWDWIGSGTYKRLKNRGNKQCLTTDHKSEDNAAWTSACPPADQTSSDVKPGQKWSWANDKWLGCYISGFVRSTSTPGRVRVNDDWFDDRADWYGYTV